MATITKYRNKWLKYHKSYEKRAYKELRQTFKKWNEIIITSDLNEINLKAQLNTLIDSNDMYEAYYAIYWSIGATHGQRVGKDINLGLKEFTMANFLQLLERELPMFFRDFAFTRIQQVHKTYLEDVFNLFNDRLLAGKTLRETTEEVFKVMRSPRFYRYQAKRIARTESTAAANYAAIKSGAVSGFVMEKQWISASDARTRRKPEDEYDHFIMHGKKVGLNEKFVFNPNSLGVDELSYPGDPKGQAANVINCRCTIGVVPKRDRNGSLIRIER